MSLRGGFPAVYPILDASFLDTAENREALLGKTVRDLAEAGVGILQYRNKTGSEAEILADARLMRDEVGSRMRLLLNDWPELAVSAGFDGVHVGQMDLSPIEARGIVGPSKIVGVSAHNEAQLRAADLQPVDYIAFGPVFATATKANPDPVVGLDGLRAARGLTGKPLVAIGGITRENAALVWQAGADSVAVISAIFSAGGDPAKLAQDFLAIRR
ncbi:MAG: thiamine phosphate synthase [Silvibacterium sp.]